MMNSGGTPAGLSRRESISLQQTGFTSFLRHRKKLWALAPLVSSFPSMLRIAISNSQFTIYNQNPIFNFQFLNLQVRKFKN
jgi:hypothetical protein